MTLPNDWAVAQVILLNGQTAPSGWTTHGTEDIAYLAVPWADYEKLDVPFDRVQTKAFKKTNGSTAAEDRFDGNDGYSVKVDGQGRLLIGKANSSGQSDDKVYMYHPVVGSNVEITVWPGSFNMVPLEGVRGPDGNPSTAERNAADAWNVSNMNLTV